jgi:hypothetical protein
MANYKLEMYGWEVKMGEVLGQYINNPEMILISKKLRIEAKSVNQ